MDTMKQMANTLTALVNGVPHNRYIFKIDGNNTSDMVSVLSLDGQEKYTVTV
ncbi:MULTISPECIES: hypothetical protein [unclassified Gilliamella]|uniref:hypothetical protein n=1 Tax=unclassified Gilliamella TaxID=2685620 RepID=UPI00132CB2EB|nr:MULTISPECIES: hypothetical protein [unclassified Gilliamella]MWN04772.1 hypothetical protein [Gilliamella sp. Pas-s95]MWP60752.1 hypothetical protein [Gilliamella sp. Pas-s25]